jgi:hypothetical protein
MVVGYRSKRDRSFVSGCVDLAASAVMACAACAACAACVACAAGCAGKSLVVNDATNPSVDTETSPPQDRTKICVVRASSTEGGTAHAVRDNGALVGATRGASHFCYLAETGDHTIRIEGGSASDSTTNLTAKGGRILFLNEEVTEVMGAVVTKLTWLEDAEARPLISSTKYVVVTSTPTGELPKSIAPRK